MSVESRFYQLEHGILEYLCDNFFQLYKEKSNEEHIELLKDWYTYLDESTKGEQYSNWLLQKIPLDDHHL